MLVDAISGKIVDVNNASLDYYGYSYADFCNLNILEINSIDADEYQKKTDEIRHDSVGRYRCRHELADGELRKVEVYTAFINLHGTDLFYSIITDISDQVDAEEKLKFGEQLFNQFMTKTPVTLAMLDNDMNYLLTSERWIQDMASGVTEIIGRNHYDIIKNQPPHWVDAYQRGLKGHSEKFEQDILIRPSGKLDWIRWEVSPWYTADHQIGGIIIFVEMITQRKKVDEISNRLIEQRSRMAAKVETIEEERRNIARELHDGLGQLLTAAHLNLDLVEQNLESNPDKIKEDLRRVKALITTTIQEVRNISQNLRPAVLDDFGLVPAIRNLCDDFRRTGSLNVQFSEYEMKEHYSPAIEIVVFRVCQEALNNIVRHAEASEASIDIYNRESHILIVIQDNGQGFDLAKISQSKTGTGLMNIKERAELLGGSVQIESQINNGTEIIIEIPLKQDEQSQPFEQ